MHVAVAGRQRARRVVGPHRRPSWRRPACSRRARSAGGTARTATADRRVRSRSRARRTVGSRRTARQCPQRRPGRTGGACRRALRGHQQRALRDTGATSSGHRHVGGGSAVQFERHGSVVAGVGIGARAQWCRTVAPFRPVSGGGGGRRRGGCAGGLRSVVGGAEVAAVPVPRRVDRDAVPAPAHRAGGHAALRRTTPRR